jgi:hypothetical protein
MWQRSIEEHGFAVTPNALREEDISKLLGTSLRQRCAEAERVCGTRTSILPLRDWLKTRDSLISRTKLWGARQSRSERRLVDKSPDSNWLVVWHQDTALPLRKKQEAHGWGPWSVKDGVIYAHAPASALCQVLALRRRKTDLCACCSPLTRWVS